MKKSELMIVLGASDNPLRPSYLLSKLMLNKGYQTLNVKDKNRVDEEIEMPVDQLTGHEDKTVAIFLKPNQQRKYYNYIFNMHPERIIFNPGTENDELIQLAQKRKIKVISGCTISLFMNGLI